MENKSITAVDWLVDNIWKSEPTLHQKILIEKARTMHEQQIIDAANGYTQTEYLGVTRGEHYYKEKYGK